MPAKVVKKKSKEEKVFEKKKDYLLHLVLFVLGIVVGLLYYKLFIVDCYLIK
jgi:hypothetical protein